ncbi:MAG TPA: peroxiredoxin [Pseudomonadales bacterium]|nr:peroxiredoxin [Pseudomonadales bacterium]
MAAIGDKIPSINLSVMGAEGPEAFNMADFCAGKKVVLFGVPGAFTPTCSAAHLPGFVVHADTLKAKGVDAIICTSVNDVFVMNAWGNASNAEHIVMAADGNAELATALDLVLDAEGFGMGKRSRRYAMIIDNGEITALNVDEGGGLDKSSAESVLALL